MPSSSVTVPKYPQGIKLGAPNPAHPLQTAVFHQDFESGMPSFPVFDRNGAGMSRPSPKDETSVRTWTHKQVRRRGRRP